MKNSLIITLLLIFNNFSLSAQKFDLRVQAGANLTFMPDFDNTIVILNDGIAVSGIISVANSAGPIILSESVSQTTPGFGFGAGLESRYNLGKDWKLSLSLGFNLMNYDFDTYITADDTPNIWLSEYTPEYGNTSLYYLNVKPLNVSKDLLNNKLTIQAGLTLNFNIYSKYNNTIIIYTEEAAAAGKTDGIERVYFDSYGNASLILAGLHGRMECKIIERLSGFISCEYFFNSVYQKETSSDALVKDSNPSQLYFGINYVFWNSGK
jgi:hypothetical protein